MLRLYNTLTRQKDEIVPLNQGKVSMYTCGPTVYRYAHIGNMRSYMMADWIRRTLLHEGNEVTHIKNITDVGHMRQDMVERGEDKMIAAALSEGKTLDEIAMFYTNAFLEDELKLNILPAQVFPRATDHVTEMIEVTEKLVEQGYGYAVEGNVYFDVSKYPNYGRLSGNQLDSLLQGVRVEVDPLKRNQTDFALWKAAEPGRMVKWPSPWGDGFPGWHIECSAMSTRYLGPQQDLHTGGVDNIFPHHEDELAQSEGAFEGQYVRYWVHGQHLLADGLKMAKSTGNSYTISELEERGFEALAFRYLCATAHYRTRLNFTFTALRGAQHALAHLRTSIRQWARSATELSPEAMEAIAAPVRERFWSNVYADLNVPAALAELWKVTGSSLPSAVKLQLITEFDTILGLGLAEVAKEPVVATSERAATGGSARRQARGRCLYGSGYASRPGERSRLCLNGSGDRDAGAASRPGPDSRQACGHHLFLRGYPLTATENGHLQVLYQYPGPQLQGRRSPLRGKHPEALLRPPDGDHRSR